MSLISSKKSKVDDRLGKYHQTIVELELKKTGLEKEIDSKKEDLENIEIRRVELNAEVADRVTQLGALDQLIAAAGIELQQEKERKSAVTTNIQTKLEVSAGIIAHQREEYARIKDQTDRIVLRLGSLKEQGEAMGNTRDAVAVEAEALRGEISRMKNQREKLVEKMRDLKTAHGSVDESYRLLNKKEILLEQREMELGLYEQRLQRRIDESGIKLKMKLK